MTGKVHKKHRTSGWILRWIIDPLPDRRGVVGSYYFSVFDCWPGEFGALCEGDHVDFVEVAPTPAKGPRARRVRRVNP